MKVILEHILPLSILCGALFVCMIIDIFVRRKKDNGFFRFLHILRTPIAVIISAVTIVLLVIWGATAMETLIALLVLLILAFL